MDIPKITFNTRYEDYDLVVISFVLTNALAIFVYLINYVSRMYLNSFVIIFINDIIVYLRSREEHEHHLRIVLHALRDNRIYAKISECEFWIESVTFIGHMESKNCIMVNSTKIETINSWLGQ